MDCKEPTKKKILITGGTVFAGKYAAKYFSEHGYEVYVLNRNTRPQISGVTLIEGDRHDLGDKLRNFHFDIVADITAYTSKDIIDLYSALGSFDRYIMVSSSAVYPENTVRPFKEDSERAANKFWGKYGTDKIEAENSLLERIPDAYILRPPYLYGPMNNVYREAFVFDCAKAGRKFYLPKSGNMKLQFFHVRDLCRFMEAIIETGPQEHIFNVGNDKAVSVKDWVTMCYACLGMIPDFVNVYENTQQRNYFCFYEYEYCLDVKRQQEIFPDTIPLAEGLRESCEWYLANEAEVNKKPYLKFIDENLVKNFIDYPLR